MPSAPRRPAIAGVAQITQRVDDPGQARSPLELMEQAIRDAAEDAGAPGLVSSLDGIYVPRGLWKYGDPGRLLGERLGSPGVETIVGAISGHIVQLLVNRACQKIAAGERDVVAIVGGESENSKRRLQRSGAPIHWDEEIPGEPDAEIGQMKFLRTDDELRAGVLNATSVFSACDTSLRAALGETPTEHRDRIATLYEQMSRIAADNPYAWIQKPISAVEIRNPSPGNRMVNYPYTKLMTSNISVDQSAALIVMSEQAADRHAVPRDQRVYLRASTEMSHTILLSQRQVLHQHPGQDMAAQRVLELAEKGPEDLDHVDLYSCFPFAVQAGAAALGIPVDPPPSLTGGMTFFGGPFGNYVLHSKAEMVARCREEPGSTGAIGAVGGSYAHFGYGIYSTDPGPHEAPLVEDVSEQFAALPMREYVENLSGEATVETYSVEVRHAGPARAYFAALTEDGKRVWGRSEDRVVMDALLGDEDACGRRARFREGLVELD